MKIHEPEFDAVSVFRHVDQTKRHFRSGNTLALKRLLWLNRVWEGRDKGKSA